MKKVKNLVSKAKRNLDVILFFAIPAIMVSSIVYFSITIGTNVLITGF